MSTRKEAIERIAAVGNWGWKGNKPGEPTADALLKRLTSYGAEDDFFDDVSYIENEVLDRFATKYPQSAYGRYWNSARQSDEFPSSWASAAAARTLLTNLKAAQDADIPREWTGKVVAGLTSGEKTLVGPETYQAVSNLMRDMNDDARELFITLLPTARGSVENLARAVRQQVKLSRLQRPNTTGRRPS